MLGSIISCGWS